MKPTQYEVSGYCNKIQSCHDRWGMGEIREGRGVRKVLRQIGCGHAQEEKMFPFLMLRGVSNRTRN
jgi:hypothetical protein